ncbi:membrane protein [Bacteroidales bacterium]|nr:membrane protein [Bacteroidales bacterium]
MRKYIICFIIVPFIFISCNDNFLDEDPSTKIGSGKLWKTQSDVELGLTGCYSRLKGSYITYTRSYLDASVDNAYALHINDAKLMQVGVLSKSSPGIAYLIYSAAYRGIATCNDFLKKVKQVDLPPADAKQYEAEARFLRAFFYNELVQRFGGVVIYREIPITLEGLKLPRSSQEQVYELISEDLDFAIINLPNVAYGEGHTVQSSALALKARVALFRGQWDEVASITKEIIEPQNSTPLYQLAQDLESQFIKGKGQKSCPEIIFSIKYTEDISGRQSNDGGQEVEFFHWSGIQPTADLMNEYDLNDKRRSEWYFQPVGATGYLRPNGKIYEVEGPLLTGWGLLKFLAKEDDRRYIANPRDILTGHDVVLIRLTDIMLMYAEAMVEKEGGSTSDVLAIKCINDIRKRAGVSHDFTTITRQQVRKERRIELAFEGFRHFDVVRWEIGDQIKNKTIYGNVKLGWEDHFYLWPFSQSEENINTNIKGNNNPNY